MFDKNNDGKISSEELGCVLRTLGQNHSPREVEEMIKNVDTNGSYFFIFSKTICGGVIKLFPCVTDVITALR